MAKRQSLYPSALDTNLQWGSQEGLEVDRQPEDRFTSDAWDLMESAILKLERQGMGYAHSIWDTDLDTGIDTEAAADEDVIRFYTDPGKIERANIDGLVMSIAEDLAHLGDANTYIQFPAGNDRIWVWAGGYDMIDITEAGAASTFFINKTLKNVDFRISTIGATNAFFIQGSDGKIGMGCADIPHGGIGAAMLALEGPDSDVNGPHIQFTTVTDNYPLLHITPYTHDNIAITFDAYYDITAGQWESSDASNFQIIKTANFLVFRYDSGVAVDGATAVSWNNGIVLDTDGKVFINDTVNTKALGPSLTIDGAGQDGEYLTLQDSTDVAHGVTDTSETATWGLIKKAESTSGGMRLMGLKDADGLANWALRLDGCLAENAITTKTTVGYGIIDLSASIKNGTTTGAVNANGNLLCVRDNANVRFIIDAEGDLYADAGVNSTDMVTKYDDFEDAHLVRAFDLARTRSKTRIGFDKFLKYNEDKLVELGILGDTLENGGLTNVTRLQQLHNGAIWQNYTAIKDHDKKLATYERAFEKISQVLGIPKQELLALGN